MTNKEASAKQEKMVASFMGWKVVAGSGNRPFTPGDVSSANFLVECKTHTTEQERIIFYKNHWIKISTEAMSKGRFPVLVVDNGTQKSSNTWVMLPKRALPEERLFKVYGLKNVSKTDSTISFKHDAASSLYKVGYNENHINYFPEWCNNEKVAIMSLEEFSKFYKEQFET